MATGCLQTTPTRSSQKPAGVWPDPNGLKQGGECDATGGISDSSSQTWVKGAKGQCLEESGSKEGQKMDPEKNGLKV